jgi:hypothetical protein
MTALGDMRTRTAGALAGLAPADDDWPVHEGPVDVVTPPCYVLVWADPWVTLVSACGYIAALDVIVVAARVDPTPGYEQAEALTAAAIPALRAAGLTFAGVTGPIPLDVAGLTYQSARIRITEPVTFPEGTP